MSQGTNSLVEKIRARTSGIRLYGMAPPKQNTDPVRLQEIIARQVERLRQLSLDGLIVYDIQDEPGRSGASRPFPFLPTIDPAQYARESLGALPFPKVIYRSVGQVPESELQSWLQEQEAEQSVGGTVLVGAPSKDAPIQMRLEDAYKVAQREKLVLPVGGIAIAERHARRFDEQDRLLLKQSQGCTFFVTQAVYDVTASKSLISDYAIACEEKGVEPVPLILTFTPCGSAKTLEFMKWLGISIPRWLENELHRTKDPLGESLKVCGSIFAELYDYAKTKTVPLGINVESVAIRKVEIDASVEMLERLSAIMAD